MIRPKPLTLIAALVFTALPLTTTHAQTDDGFRPLFNGKDLDGWVRVTTDESTWSVQDGVLHCTGKPIGELRTDRMYQNFILEVDWRHLEPKGNAGIFIWADDITARGQPFHRAIEVQVLENAYGDGSGHTTHGDMFPIHGARMRPLTGKNVGKASARAFPTEHLSKPAPEWNHYRIECRDGAISLAVNGKVVTKGDNASPSKGYICIESEGGVAEYRNMRIQALPDTPIDDKDVATADRGYRCLYRGVNLEGWTLGEAGREHWKPSDWVLKYDGGKAEGDVSLTSTEQFGDVGFVVDVKLGKGSDGLAIGLRGGKEPAFVVTPDTIKGAAATNGFVRFTGELRGDKLTLIMNDVEVCKDKPIGNVADTGPLRLTPMGPVDLANIFVRELK